MNAILPLLSRYLPVHYAVQGLSKINPKVGNFISTAAGSGYTTDSILDFLRDKAEGSTNKNTRMRLEQGSAQGTNRPDQESALTEINRARLPGNIAQGAATLGAAALGGKLLSQESSQAQGAQPQGLPQQSNPLAEFPELEKFIQQKISEGQTPQGAAGLAMTSSRFQPMVKKLEKMVGIDFLNLISQIFGGQSQAALQPDQAQTPQSQAALQPQGQQNNSNQALLEAIQAYRASKGR